MPAFRGRCPRLLYEPPSGIRGHNPRHCCIHAMPSARSREGLPGIYPDNHVPRVTLAPSAQYDSQRSPRPGHPFFPRSLCPAGAQYSSRGQRPRKAGQIDPTLKGSHKATPADGIPHIRPSILSAIPCPLHPLFDPFRVNAPWASGFRERCPRLLYESPSGIRRHRNGRGVPATHHPPPITTCSRVYHLVPRPSAPRASDLLRRDSPRKRILLPTPATCAERGLSARRHPSFLALQQIIERKEIGFPGRWSKKMKRRRHFRIPCARGKQPVQARALWIPAPEKPCRLRQRVA